jgi:hypothetical protein
MEGIFGSSHASQGDGVLRPVIRATGVT